MPSTPHLPDHIRKALEQGRKIEAIKQLREAEGLGLKEAKDIIDQYEGKTPREFSGVLSDPASVAEALQGGHKILAIKRLREQTGMGLKEAKEAIESMQKDLYGPTQTGHSNRLSWAIIVLALIGFTTYYLMK